MSDRLLKWLLGFLGLAFVAGVGAYIYNNDAGFFTINPEPTPSATATPKPTQSTVAVMRVAVPANSSCKDCHTQGNISVPDVPPMGHRLDGWDNCTQCHGVNKLVKTAPGHRGIHRDSCLLCHTQQGPATVSVPPRLHRAYPDKSCTSCHKPGGTVLFRPTWWGARTAGCATSVPRMKTFSIPPRQRPDALPALYGSGRRSIAIDA